MGHAGILVLLDSDDDLEERVNAAFDSYHEKTAKDRPIAIEFEWWELGVNWRGSDPDDPDRLLEPIILRATEVPGYWLPCGILHQDGTLEWFGWGQKSEAELQASRNALSRIRSGDEGRFVVAVIAKA
jgi:hypothetical protein